MPPSAGTVGAGLADAIGRLAHAPILLIALDFDGTLAPFVDRPEAARATPRAKAAIARLRALENTTVAYVSGRPVDSLVRVTEASPAEMLIGSHGVELRIDGRSTEVQLEAGERLALAELDEALTAIAGRYDGAHLERKPAGIALHTRPLTPTDAAMALTEARAAAGFDPALTVRDGKDVLEFSVRGATKGDGVRRLRQVLKASAVLFAGDDVTDEDGFAVLEDGDVGIKVGDGETAARHRVADPDALAGVLDLLAADRAAVLGRS